MILSVVERIYRFFQYKFLPGEQPDELKLPKRFDMIKNKVQNEKNSNLQARANRSSLINFNKSKKLFQGIECSKILMKKHSRE